MLCALLAALHVQMKKSPHIVLGAATGLGRSVILYDRSSTVRQTH
jgi:hypothetical protein